VDIEAAVIEEDVSVEDEEKLPQLKEKLEAIGQVNLGTLDEYEELTESSSWRDVRVWGENADRFFPNEEKLTGWIDQPCIVPFLAQLPEPVKGSFRDLVVQRMIAATKQDDGTYFETFRRINVSAVK